MDIVFESKRDAWIVMLIWAGILMCVYAGLQFARVEPSPRSAFIVVVCGASAGFMLWVLYGISYTLTDEELLIRCGPFRFRVPLASIVSVQASRNPLSSPAASLDRLLIRYDTRRRILISPTPRSDFLRELGKRCPQLQLGSDPKL